MMIKKNGKGFFRNAESSKSWLYSYFFFLFTGAVNFSIAAPPAMLKQNVHTHCLSLFLWNKKQENYWTNFDDS
ncbi:MAG: hypothetical protein J7L58_06605, partial [Thermoplasmata archaeon]|nr:hypothetical protein [Thermoplasmata archaeon]